MLARIDILVVIAADVLYAASIMGKESPFSCARCQALEQKIAVLTAAMQQLQEELAAARKTSATSSKPPSSDIVKPPPTRNANGQKRSIGGQPGHPLQARPLVPAAALTEPAHVHYIEICPCCGHGLKALKNPPRVMQQIDIREVPISCVEHRRMAGWCSHCQMTHYAPLPKEVQASGLVGPRLTALIAYMKGVCHASYSTVRTFLRDVVGVTISRGQLAKVVAKVSAALAACYQELYAELGKQPRLNVDETGHKQNGEAWWTWCFHAELYTLYKIDARRSADVLMEALGRDFAGVLGCDYFSAYRRYMRECGVAVQFCLAHLIRDIKYLKTLPDARDRRYGEQLRKKVKRLFEVIHNRQTYSPLMFDLMLKDARNDLVRIAIDRAPATRHGQNMAKRFVEHGAAYFQFITTPMIGPTNNLAEQAIRFVVIDRHVTQGTRGERGQRWCERIWTVIATCAQQGRSVLEFLGQAVQAYFHKEPGPSLLGG